MSKLREIFTDLSYGELQGIAIGNLIASDNESEPDPKNYAQLISHINAGMRKLHSRFFCRALEIYIEQNEAVETYYLKNEYAQSNTASAIPIENRYIADPTTNFDETSLLKIEQVFDEEGCLLKLNDFSDPLSIFSPTYNAIQIPWPNEFNTVAVQYRATHDKILYSVDMDIDTTDVPVPMALYNALLLYVAFRAMPRLDGGAEKGQMFQMYDDECKRVEQEGLHPQAEPGDWRFDAKGWV
jgi:hypothetical protein